MLKLKIFENLKKTKQFYLNNVLVYGNNHYIFNLN